MNYQKALSILGFNSKPTPEELKKRYRSLSSKYHPDIAGNEYEDKFKEIVEANRFLKENDAPVSLFNGKSVFTHQTIFSILHVAR